MSVLRDKLENRMLQNQLDAYLDNYGIKEKKLDVAFEHFCNYCIFSLFSPEAYRNDILFYHSVHTGGGNDTAIDGILILINDIPVTTLDEAKTYMGLKRGFTAKFVFVQAKTSPNFESGEMLKTGIGVKNFFWDGMKNVNEKVKNFKLISDYIFEHSIDFIESPICKIYYVTTGKWTDDYNLCSLIQDRISELQALNYFSDVEYVPIDINRLMTIFKEINNSITREVIIAKNVAFPEIKGAEKVYLGIITMGEYMKLITDDGGALLQGVFYDNVRGFLGDNPVNKEIVKTLQNKDTYVQFPILNNGITIVAKNMGVSGDKFKLTDYQIVNGCQTSNVLYLHRSEVNENMMIPIKIVHTESPELVNSVIRSTNRQTIVLDEAFESLKEFHKQLQDYYDTYRGENRLYYERRAHEYDDRHEMKRFNIITLPIQLKSYMSMFLGEPHSMHRYYGDLLRNSSNKVFLPDHKLISYYTSALVLNRIEKSMNDGDIDIKKCKCYKYHFLYLFQAVTRSLLGYKKVPFPNSKDMETLCGTIQAIINDDKKYIPILHLTEDIIQKTLVEYDSMYTNPNGNGPERTKEFTQMMQQNANLKLSEIEKLLIEK